jgi:hypothetical protein
MDNIQQKALFLKEEYTRLLRQLDPSAERRWGKMNVQQMVEHMADSVRIANGNDPHELVSPEEHVPKMQAFLMSDKPFKENTPNRLLPDEPVAVRHEDIKASIDELQREIDQLFRVFEEEGKTVMNPFFGSLNHDMWIQLLHKHAWHHLKQFGVEQETVS